MNSINNNISNSNFPSNIQNASIPNNNNNINLNVPYLDRFSFDFPYKGDNRDTRLTNSDVIRLNASFLPYKDRILKMRKFRPLTNDLKPKLKTRLQQTGQVVNDNLIDVLETKIDKCLVTRLLNAATCTFAGNRKTVMIRDLEFSKKM